MARWDEMSEGDILHDINSALSAVWESEDCPVYSLTMPERMFLHIARSTMHKRRWRRWYGKYKAFKRG